MSDRNSSLDLQGPLEELRRVASALSDSNRLRIIVALTDGPQNVTKLTEALDLRQPLVSHHLAVLVDAGLTEVRREGRCRVYELRPESPSILPGLGDAIRSLGEAPRPESVRPESARFGSIRSESARFESVRSESARSESRGPGPLVATSTEEDPSLRWDPEPADSTDAETSREPERATVESSTERPADSRSETHAETHPATPEPVATEPVTAEPVTTEPDIEDFLL